MTQWCPYVSGPCLVKVNLRDGNGVVDLGYTAEGVQVEEQLFEQPIHSDRYGGSAGPPVDKQWFGKSARIPLQLVEYDLAVVKLMRQITIASTWSTMDDEGGIVDIGALTSCTNQSWQVILVGSLDSTSSHMTPLNFPNCFPTGAIRYPLGAKNTIFDIDLHAIPFTTDTAQSGDGKTYLWLNNSSAAIADLHAFDATP